jgi:long-chain acyl-CoA synthetase
LFITVRRNLLLLKNHQKTALNWKNEDISYQTLLKTITYFNKSYLTAKSNKIAIIAENRPEWIYAFYAGWKNNSIIIPIDYLSTQEELNYILNDCRPEIVFYSNQTSDCVSDTLKSLNYKQKSYNLDELTLDTFSSPAEEIPLINPDSTAVIIYTSGTTGSPKGVMLSFDNLLANVEAVTIGAKIYTTDRNVLIMLPLHHIFPLLGTMVAPLFVGAKTAITPSLTSADIMNTLKNNKIAIIIGVPRFYRMIKNGIKEKIDNKFVTRFIFRAAGIVKSQSLSKKIFKSVHQKFGGHIKFLVSGGAKLDKSIGQYLQTLGFEVLEGFGMTEAAPMITFTRPGCVIIGSPGQAISTLEVRIKDGEIIARGRNIMQGYYNRPMETSEVLQQGWLHTGDLGHINKQGFLFITGRKKEIIPLPNGKNINPEEIENKISSLSNLISEIGVFLKDDILQAAIYPNFSVVNKENISNLSETFRWEIIDKYNQKTSPYKKINKFILVKNELPKTRLGKIQRFKLAKILSEVSMKTKSLNIPEFKEYLVIQNYLKAQINRNIFPDDHFEIDLGLDSLDKVSFLTFLNTTFGIETSEDIFFKYPTVEKLSLQVSKKRIKISISAVKWAEIFKEKVEIILPKSWFTQNIMIRLSKTFFKIYFRFKSEGTVNLPQGPCIITPNHQSFFDGLFVASFLKNRIMNRTYFYAKEKHVRKKWVKFIADRHNIIIMDINQNLKLSMQKMVEVLKRGKNIIIFPEGTRSKDGNLGTFKKTFAIISRELNIPVVPVSIKGAYEAIPRGKRFPKPFKKIFIKFLPPVYPNHHSYESLIKEVYNQIKLELLAGYR